MNRWTEHFARIGMVASCLAVVAFSAVAGPDITVTRVSGEFTAGNTVIIEGADFGTKAQALPKLWDDFEGGAIGTGIGTPVQGVYTRTGSTVYSSQAPYAGARCALSDVDGTGGDPGLVSNWIPEEAKNVFISMKWKMVSEAGSLSPHNIKLLRTNSHVPDPAHGEPDYDIGSDRGYTSFSGIVNHGLMGQVYVGAFNESMYSYGGWNSLSMWDKLGDPDVANGFAGRRLNGSVEERHDIVTLQGGASTEAEGLRSSYFAGYISHEGYDVQVWLDDVYADVSLARVEVFADGGFHEMQLPVAWGDDRIEIRAHLGGLQPGSSASLVVYDSDNNPSPPFRFTVGGDPGDGDLGAPGAPGRPVHDQ